MLFWAQLNHVQIFASTVHRAVCAFHSPVECGHRLRKDQTLFPRSSALDHYLQQHLHLTTKTPHSRTVPFAQQVVPPPSYPQLSEPVNLPTLPLGPILILFVHPPVV